MKTASRLALPPSLLLLLLPLVALVLLAIVAQGNALLCHTCSYTLAGKNDSCLRDPQAVSKIIDCDKKYCTIMRQESTKPAGKVISLVRDCLDEPLFLNRVIADETFKTFYRSCKSDLCNDSDGKQTPANADWNHGAAPNSIVKGRDAATMACARVGVPLLLAIMLLHVIA